MILQISSVVVFNLILYKTIKGISANKIVHIWVFTIAFQLFFDIFIDLKYKGYWYFTQGIDWIAFPAYTILIPPVNLMFINWYPFNSSFKKKVRYFIIWELFLLSYEAAAMLPHPFGFFHYGWWSIWHSAIVNPILLTILIGYYKWISVLEKKACI
ncbi:hypothetical protein DFO70_10664 [Cytobacillus firmus]|uniref:Uncharacterized protein n=2 Tax=Cytobacillus TaxID=2675230 RepID=A0A366JW81_CYTFI|nr:MULTISPECIES: hypothetical protein [Cytobacillus]RBP92935.1 hypothetical protein DFO70_10664 [Cytobacillus firmus]TDX42537.1 hypothetical protein DFO72_10664 [Cytobacillus oceanisediminis]